MNEQFDWKKSGFHEQFGLGENWQRELAKRTGNRSLMTCGKTNAKNKRKKQTQD